ncbi:MAG: hypothetical protein IT561_26550, partial [Alphaproteobacteria bacterium]|nr:hypothetical protein [Alphaproteobacteria bacterium]
LIHRDEDLIAETRKAFNTLDFPAGSLDQNMLDALTNSSSGETFLAKQAAAIELLSDGWTSETEQILSHACEPTVLAAALNGDNWQQNILKEAAEQAAANGYDIGKAMAEIVVGIDQAVAPVLSETNESAVTSFRQELVNVLSNAWKGIANGFGELSDKYEEVPYELAHLYSPEEMRAVARSFDDAINARVDEPGSSLVADLRGTTPDVRNALAAASRGLMNAAQQIVIHEGRGDNPFDDPAFNGSSVVASTSMNEGRVRTFTAYLPFAADTNGQRIAFQLTGNAVSKFEVLQYADPLPVDVNGRFELVVPEGSREVTFGLHAMQDIDVDEALSLSAQLLANAGTATHQPHVEVTVAFDAAAEPTSTPTNLRIGTAEDDNRGGDATHRQVAGTSGADRLQGLAGRDELYGGAGDDVIEAGPGADMATAEAGNDRVFANTYLDEAALRNYIQTTADIIDNTHAPAIHAIESGDWLVGGLGDDTVVGDATADVLFGGGGADIIVGGAGHDVISADDDYEPGLRNAEPHLTGITVTRNWKGNPFEVYYSEAQETNYAYLVGADDVIHAGAGDDFVTASYGNDTAFGDEGDDTIAGNAGSDSLFGGAGKDRITGDNYGTLEELEPAGDDYLDGGDGDDTLTGEGGADVLVGGDGNDRLYGFIDVTFVNAPNEDPAIDGDDHLSGGAGADYLVGASGADTLIGGDDADQLFGDGDSYAAALHGNDYLDGGNGADYLRGYGGDDTMIGGADADTLQGEAGDDILDGGLDDDIVFGMEGADEIAGGDGKDQLAGGDGNDFIDGGAGVDAIWGEGGDDEIHTGVGGAPGDGADFVDAGDGDDRVLGASGGATLWGMSGNDTIQGGSDADQIMGGIGKDELNGGAGADTVWGDADDDAIAGEAGDDQLMGGDGNDRLEGGIHGDQLFGEAGIDTLNGGAGRDYLLGGAGDDIYEIDAGSGEDIIIDDEGQNRLRFADDIDAADLSFRRG